MTTNPCRVRSLRFYRVGLTSLFVLFLLRVTGQGLVACGHDLGILPPMEAWQSGLLPYHLLFLSQLVILGFELSLLRSFFGATPPPSNAALGKHLDRFGKLYLGVMIGRAIVRLALPGAIPGGWIPICFHCVLAGFVLLLGDYHLRGGIRRHMQALFSIDGGRKREPLRSHQYRRSGSFPVT